MKITTVPYTSDPALSLPDPRWERPEMLIPRQRPTGNLAVNREHKLANGLLSVGMPVGTDHLLDLETGDIHYKDAGSTFGKVAPSQYGLGHYAAVGSYGCYWWPGSFGYEHSFVSAIAKIAAAGLGSVGVAFYFIDTHASESPILAARVGSAGGRVYIHAIYSSGYYLSTSYNDWTYTALTAKPLTQNAFHTAGLMFDSSTEYSVLDGDVIDERAGGGTVSGINNVGFMSYGHSTAYGAAGYLYAACIWDRLLSDAEWLAFHNDPYQFLIPA